MVFYRRRRIVQIFYKKYRINEILHERNIRWPKEFWVQSEWFNNNKYYETKSLRNVRMSLVRQRQSPKTTLMLSRWEKKSWRNFMFLEMDSWTFQNCENEWDPGSSWLRWWQIQSVEIHRSPSELPLNTPPPEYNGIHKSKQIQKYKSTKAFSKIYTKTQIQRHNSYHSFTSGRKICHFQLVLLMFWDKSIAKFN